MQCEEESSSVLVPGVNKTETVMSERTSTKPRSFIAEAPPCSNADLFPEGSRIVCSSIPNPRIGQDKHNVNLDATVETIHPQSLPCNRFIVSKEACPMTSNDAVNSTGANKGLSLLHAGEGKESVDHDGDGVCNDNNDEEPHPQGLAEVKRRLEMRKDKFDSNVSSDDQDKRSTGTCSTQEKVTQDKIDSLQITIKGSINTEDPASETVPLLSENAKRRQKAKFNRRKQFQKPVVILAFLLAIIFLSATILVLLYEFNVFTDASTSTHNTLALPGDYVLLPYHINGYVMYHYILYFNVLPNVVLYPVDIYSFPCDTLPAQSKTIGVSPSSSSSNSPAIPILKRIYFGHCSKPRYDDKCVLDQYIYQAKSPVSELNYDITLDNFTVGVTDVRILVYDNTEYFMKYLKGGENSKAMKIFAINDINFRFVFNNDQMRESSYYFVAIEDVEGSSEWFTVSYLGLHVYYNASAYTPLCVMNSNNNYSCKIEVIDENQCFLGHVKGERVKGVPTAEQQFHILHHLSDPMPTNKGRWIILGGCFSPVILIALCCWCVCNRRLVLEGLREHNSDDQDNKLREI